MTEPFVIISPKKGTEVPFILSIPHCGTDFPEEIKDHYIPEMTSFPDDTDWYLERLYSFASDLGITIIHAKYSRWVIDLNRDPESKPLYNDGRIITSLTPNTDFLGKKIYKEDKYIPDEKEINRRLQLYYLPYYKKLEQLLEERKKEFGKVLLWDAHSIRHYVPTIRKEPFPEMILGNNDETSAGADLIHTAYQTLKSGKYFVSHNTPFKGGHITRYFGNPQQQIHALQLEMNKNIYMDDKEIEYHPQRAKEVRSLLQNTFEQLIFKLNQ